jgi:hypothetical protein
MKRAELSPTRGLLLGTLLALLVAAIVWLPELAHWYVPGPRLDDATVQALRSGPPDSALAEIGNMALVAARPDGDVQRTLLRANEILNGMVAFPGYLPMPIQRPFSADDLVQGPATWQLLLASLSATDTLLDAYAATGDERYFKQAHDDILAFAEVEAGRWVNRGFLWNDHAIAARIPVLVKFWRVYRRRADFDPVAARSVLALAHRSAVLLTRDSHYAFRTGHGIISDLAALQVSIAFPQLDPEGRFRSHAQRRFEQHLAYYISPEGVTLLHSAGYHGTGLEFFGMALRLYSLAGTPIPDEWWQRYDKAVEHYARLRQPGGTLPMYGDTRSVSEGNGPPLTARDDGGRARPLRPRSDWPAPAPSFDAYPLSGHVIWWDSAGTGTAGAPAGTQTAVTWSYFPGLGHKLADDLSLVTWSGGRRWITNVGYWPWGFWGRAQATSWAGSNAPHRDGERAASKRSSRLLGTVADPRLTVVDLLREGPDGFKARRQVLRLPERELWLVLDDTSGGAQATTHWTFAPDLTAGQPEARRFRLIDKAGHRALTMSIDGPTGIGYELMRGSRSPFGGWAVEDREPVPAPTVVVRQSAASAWALAAFAIGPADQPTATVARMGKWTDAEHWTIAVDTPDGRLEVSRDGDRIHLSGADAPAALALAATPMPAVQREAVLGALAEAERRYPRFVERVHYRVRWSRWLGGAFVGQELLLAAVARLRRRWLTPLRLLTLVAWAAGGLWLGFVYFEGMWW